MKLKHILLSFTFLLTTVSIQAQFSFGIKGSVQQTWYGDKINPFSKNNKARLTGLGTTVQLYYQTGKHVSFGLEPGIVQRGASNPTYYECFFFCGTGLDYMRFPYNGASIYSNYLQLPVFMQYRASLFKNKMEFFTKLGAGPAYAIAAYQQSDFILYSEESDIIPIEFSSEDGFNRIDVGLFGGMGIGWHFPFGTITLEVETFRGLKPVHDYFQGFNNQSRGLSLGYRIDL